MSAYSHWSTGDWIEHYAGGAAQTAGTWGPNGRRQPAAYGAGQSILQRAEHAVERGEHAVENVAHRASRAVHQGVEKVTSPPVLLAGIAALGILGWVLVQSGRTVGRTVEGVAPHAAKALPLFI